LVLPKLYWDKNGRLKILTPKIKKPRMPERNPTIMGMTSIKMMLELIFFILIFNKLSID
jgi:hypothetical protein